MSKSAMLVSFSVRTLPLKEKKILRKISCSFFVAVSFGSGLLVLYRSQTQRANDYFVNEIIDRALIHSDKLNLARYLSIKYYPTSKINLAGLEI